MPKDKKERTVNPATAALKASKSAAIKKSRAAQHAQRSEKLARRNPHRLQQQIDALVASREQNGGVLRPRDKEMLEKLEREVGAVKRARERMGVEDKDYKGRRDDDEASGYRRERDGGDRGGRGGGVLGKRRREDGRRGREEESDTDPEARDIPMPKDVENMPPIPRRRPHHPLQQQGKPAVESAPAQTVYSSAPQIRNLQKEAVSRFLPSSVASKIAATKGVPGKLLEPEEADALEKSGYSTAGVQGVDEVVQKAADEAEKELEYRLMSREEEEGAAETLEEEERRFMNEVRKVEIEEVEDEDL
jgi:WW domain binding protein 11